MQMHPSHQPAPSGGHRLGKMRTTIFSSQTISSISNSLVTIGVGNLKLRDMDRVTPDHERVSPAESMPITAMAQAC